MTRVLTSLITAICVAGLGTLAAAEDAGSEAIPRMIPIAVPAVSELSRGELLPPAIAHLLLRT